MKICTTCKIEQPVSEFCRNKNTKDGLNSKCRICSSDYHKEYRKSHAPLLNERSRQWRVDNPDRYRALMKNYSVENSKQIVERVKGWRLDNPDRFREGARAHAMRRYARKLEATTFPFTTGQLAQKWAYWGNKCWICGEEATQTDHVKPLSRGGAHMLCNLRPACAPCNQSKNSAWPLDDWLGERRARKQLASV